MNIENYILQLDENTNRTIELIIQCPDEKLQVATPGSWSVLLAAEHICKTDKLISKLLLRSTDSRVEKDKIFGDERLRYLVVDKRNRKVKSPDILLPTGIFQTKEDFEQRFSQQRNHLKEILLAGEVLIDNRSHQHPYLGDMIIEDWLYFIIHHTDRHLEQIKELLSAFETKDS